MHMRRDDMHIYVSSLLKYKMYLYLCDSIRGYLHYATIKFKVQIYICYVIELKIALDAAVASQCQVLLWWSTCVVLRPKMARANMDAGLVHVKVLVWTVRSPFLGFVG
jgi:hypothetical protein